MVLGASLSLVREENQGPDVACVLSFIDISKPQPIQGAVSDGFGTGDKDSVSYCSDCASSAKGIPIMTGEFADEKGPTGCYLTFEPASGGRMMLHYTQHEIPLNAIGFWTPGPGKSIQGFKFKNRGGRSELINGIAGGDQNRRKFFSGWCQFVKLAKSYQGYVIKFPNADQGVEVDVYGYIAEREQCVTLDLDEGLIEVGDFDAVACVPKHNTKLQGVKSIVLSNFMELGNLAGAASLM